MSNTINITKCDNQLVIYAVNANGSYEICNIQSGNYNDVNLNIDITSGAFTQTYNPSGGVTAPLSGTVDVAIPSGTYSLVYTGLNWGGPYNFEFEFQNKTYNLVNNPDKPLEGAIWNLGNLEIEFTV